MVKQNSKVLSLFLAVLLLISMLCVGVLPTSAEQVVTQPVKQETAGKAIINLYNINLEGNAVGGKPYKTIEANIGDTITYHNYAYTPAAMTDDTIPEAISFQIHYNKETKFDVHNVRNARPSSFTSANEPEHSVLKMKSLQAEPPYIDWTTNSDNAEKYCLLSFNTVTLLQEDKEKVDYNNNGKGQLYSTVVFEVVESGETNIWSFANDIKYMPIDDIFNDATYSDLIMISEATVSPVPTTTVPVPTTTVPVPTTTVPVPTTTAPVPTTKAPVPTTTAPVPTTTVPVPTTTVPVPTTKAPVPTTIVPVPTTKAPVPTTIVPVPTTKAPVPTTTAPVPTTKAPVPTTTAPVPTTKAPVPTTTAPVPTTKAPVPTTTAPPEQKKVGIYGDVNGDGEVDLQDALIISKHTAKLLTIEGDLAFLGDVNKDGEIALEDLLMVQRYIAKFPAVPVGEDAYIER